VNFARQATRAQCRRCSAPGQHHCLSSRCSWQRRMRSVAAQLPTWVAERCGSVASSMRHLQPIFTCCPVLTVHHGLPPAPGECLQRRLLYMNLYRLCAGLPGNACIRPVGCTRQKVPADSDCSVCLVCQSAAACDVNCTRAFVVTRLSKCCTLPAADAPISRTRWPLPTCCAKLRGDCNAVGVQDMQVTAGRPEENSGAGTLRHICLHVHVRVRVHTHVPDTIALHTVAHSYWPWHISSCM
jgi:hypothetical protein